MIVVKSARMVARSTNRKAIVSFANYTTNNVSSEKTIKITTYNVLSSHLAEPDYFKYCNPDHLDAPTRLKVCTLFQNTFLQYHSIYYAYHFFA
jgi:mRNA deadenylase 3'-5' endonuclease subunit Ccr4